MIPPRKLIRVEILYLDLGSGVVVGVRGTGEEVMVGDGVNVGVGVRTGNKRVREGNGSSVVVGVELTVGVGEIVTVSVGVEVESGREVKVTI
jgi:hypothetical protein